MATEIIERKVYYSVKINFHHNWESKIVNLPGLNANLSEFFFFLSKIGFAEGFLSSEWKLRKIKVYKKMW